MLAKSPKYFFYLIYFSILILVSVHFMMNFGLSYVNVNGCYRSYTSQSGQLSNGVKTYYDALQANCQSLTPWYSYFFIIATPWVSV
jgi:hypothetical protein